MVQIEGQRTWDPRLRTLSLLNLLIWCMRNERSEHGLSLSMVSGGGAACSGSSEDQQRS
jgi:hypothetical protein